MCHNLIYHDFWPYAYQDHLGKLIVGDPMTLFSVPPYILIVTVGLAGDECDLSASSLGPGLGCQAFQVYICIHVFITGYFFIYITC